MLDADLVYIVVASYCVHCFSLSSCWGLTCYFMYLWNLREVFEYTILPIGHRAPQMEQNQA